MTWSNFVVRVGKDGSIEYYRISSDIGTAEGSDGISKSKNVVVSLNGKARQPSGEPQDCDVYLYQRAFPGTWGAGMQWWLWYMTNMGCGGCQECKTMCRFYCRYCVEKG